MNTSKKLGTTEILFRCAQQMQLEPSWLIPQEVFAISVNGAEQYINYTRSPLNSHASVSLAQDKYLTRLILARHKLVNIPFAQPLDLSAATMFLNLHGSIIAKPLKGSGARDIHIITEVSEL